MSCAGVSAAAEYTNSSPQEHVFYMFAFFMDSLFVLVNFTLFVFLCFFLKPFLVFTPTSVFFGLQYFSAQLTCGRREDTYNGLVCCLGKKINLTMTFIFYFSVFNTL